MEPGSLTDKVRNLPDGPGVYQFFDIEENLLYVGKAKSLRKRVASYFTQSEGHSGKTRVLVRKIADLKYLVVETEQDALFLENSLIKSFQPPYNIQLKDDKTYPWICIKNEHFPRVVYTRDLVSDGSEYFGPYGRVKVVNTLMELIPKLFKLRNCNLSLTHANIAAGKFSSCLEFQIGNCLAPCMGRETESHYDESIRHIRKILKGDIGSVIALLDTEMKNCADALEFEKAHALKQQIDVLGNFQAKSTIVNPGIDQVEVYSIVSDERSAFVNFMKIQHGAIVQAHTVEYKKKLDERDEDILTIAIADFRSRFNTSTKHILLPFPTDLPYEGIEIQVPERGDKKKLVLLSLKNARQLMTEQREAEERQHPETRVNRLMEKMQKDFRLAEQPRHIECFDNSNFQGTDAVAACVVFKNGRPSKRDYRHFNIKTVVGPDDFSSMHEVVTRRYSRMLAEGSSLPQLIVIDGGKGQLSAAVSALDAIGLRGKLAIIGIAKRLEEIYYPGDSTPIYLDKASESLRIIQHLRNEAHRFGITHHRNKRSKSSVSSVLDQIEGIGEKTKELLLKKFKSVKKIQAAERTELEALIGKSKTDLLYEGLKPQSNKDQKQA